MGPAELRAAFEAGAVATAIVGARGAERGRLLKVNEALCSLLRYPASDLERMSLSALCEKADLPRIEPHLADLLAGRVPAVAAETRCTRADAEVVWIRLHLTAVGDEGGEVRCAVAQLEDLSAEKEGEALQARLEHELAQSRRLEGLGQLVAGAAHDFRNSLSLILSYAALAKDKAPPKEVLADIEEIERASQHAEKFTRQLLAVGRSEGADRKLEDPNRLISTLEPLLQRTVGEGIELSLRLAPDSPLIHASEGELEQLLINLAANARDATAEGGRLQIRAALATVDGSHPLNTELAKGDYLRLTVSDDGGGMTSDVLEQAFDTFFTTKESDQGTGLGLATVRGIAVRLGGRVDVRSEPGRGTTFEIHLPGRPRRLERTGRFDRDAAMDRELIQASDHTLNPRRYR